MKIISLTSREFNRNMGRAKTAALRGHVYITDRGRPAQVLLSFDEYQQIMSQQKSVVALLSMPEAPKVTFEPVPISNELYHPADFDWRTYSIPT